MTITITRTGGSAGSLSAALTVGGGSSTASAPADFTAPAPNPTTITFADGNTTPQTLVIPIIDDSAVEGSETIALTLATPTGAPNTATLTIVDNDSNANNQAPRNVSVTPAKASVAAATEQVLSAVYSDPDGINDLGFVYLRVNPAGRPSNRDVIVLRYDVSNNALSILNDAGTRFLGNVAPGTTGPFNTVSNSQAIFAPARTLVTRAGNNLTVKWSFKAKTSLAGTVNDVSLCATDLSGQSDNVGGFNSVAGFERFGSLRIVGNVAPTNVSLDPADPTEATNAPNQERIFTAVYNDPNGFKNLDVVRLRVKGAASKSFADDLIVSYDVQRNEMFLINADGTSFNARGQRPQVASGTLLINSRGSLNPRNSRVTRQGNTLTVAWAMTASSSFTGVHPVDLLAQDKGGLGTGYEFFGTWTITTPGASVATRSVALSSGTANAAKNSVTLKSARALDAAASDPTQYRVQVNGTSVEVQSAVVQGSTTVTLLLPAGSLQPGATVNVSTPSGSITTTAK